MSLRSLSSLSSRRNLFQECDNFTFQRLDVIFNLVQQSRRGVLIEVPIEVDLVPDDPNLAVLVVALRLIDPSIRDMRPCLSLQTAAWSLRSDSAARMAFWIDAASGTPDWYVQYADRRAQRVPPSVFLSIDLGRIGHGSKRGRESFPAERPFGCFAEKTPAPFSAGVVLSDLVSPASAAMAALRGFRPSRRASTCSPAHQSRWSARTGWCRAP